MKQKKVYCPPLTKMAQVQLEGVICASADIKNPDETNGRIDAHEVNTGFDYTLDNNEWSTTSN